MDLEATARRLRGEHGCAGPPAPTAKRATPQAPADTCRIAWCTAPVVPRAGPGPRNKYCQAHLDLNSRRRAASRAGP